MGHSIKNLIIFCFLALNPTQIRLLRDKKVPYCAVGVDLVISCHLMPCKFKDKFSDQFLTLKGANEERCYMGPACVYGLKQINKLLQIGID